MNEPVWLTRELVVAIHQELITEYGGSPGLRDEGLFESALARPKQVFAYGNPTLAELAAAYAFGLAKNHAFVDGNKRIALAAADVFRQLNGRDLQVAEVEAVAVFQDLAAGELGEPELTVWLERNSKPMPA